MQHKSLNRIYRGFIMHTDSHINNKRIPGWGEPACVSKSLKKFEQNNLKKKITTYTATIFAAMGIGYAAANLPGLIVAACATPLILATIELFRQIWGAAYEKKKMNSVLPPEILKAIPNTQPELGVESHVNLRVSTHVAEAFEWKKKLIETAEQSIEISPNFVGGASFIEFLKVLERRMKERPNLKVHMIYSKELLEKEDKTYLKRLKKTFPQFKCLPTTMQVHLSSANWTEENHSKLLVVDEKYFVIGGSGINDVQVTEETPPNYKPKSLANKFIMPKSFKDTDVIGEGMIAARMRTEFFKLYSIWEQRTKGSTTSHYFPISGIKGSNQEFSRPEGLFKQAKLRLYVGGPEHNGENPITNAIADHIQSAEKTVRIANSQFNPDKKIVEAIKSARKMRKVKVIGQFNGNVSKQMVVYPSRPNYEILDHVYEYKKGDTMYHSKLQVIDDKKVIIGSYNLGMKSAYFDHEITVVIDDERVAAKVNEALDDDLKKSQEFKKQHPFIQKITSIPGMLLGQIFYNLS